MISTLVLHAALGASLLTSHASVRPAALAREPCASPQTDIASWPIVRSPRVPGLTLRLPRSFQRDSGDSAPSSATSVIARARWADASRGQLVISRGAVPPAELAAPAAGQARYSRCEERVGSAAAVIESYDRRDAVGVVAGAGPFLVQARLRWPDGEELVVVGDAADRERFIDLLAAVRTIRRTAA